MTAEIHGEEIERAVEAGVKAATEATYAELNGGRGAWELVVVAIPIAKAMLRDAGSPELAHEIASAMGDQARRAVLARLGHPETAEELPSA